MGCAVSRGEKGQNPAAGFDRLVGGKGRIVVGVCCVSSVVWDVNGEKNGFNARIASSRMQLSAGRHACALVLSGARSQHYRGSLAPDLPVGPIPYRIDW